MSCINNINGNNGWGNITGIRPVKMMKKLIADGYTYDEAKLEFIRSYLVSEEKAELLAGIAKKQLALLLGDGCKEVCLYIGIPFCKTRCLYCSFITAESGTEQVLVQPFVEALMKELSATAGIVRRHGLSIKSIYFGGGTPTILTAEQLKQIIDGCKSFFNLEGLKEFTVEAGRPDTLDESKFFAMKVAGVTRISINPQSMKDETLRAIGRRHSAEDIVKAFKMARLHGFDDINADVIAGLPFETADDFKATLNELEKLLPESVTVHTMSIKRGSRLHETLGDVALSDAAVVEEMTDYAREFMKNAGREPYYLYRQKNMLGNLENTGYAKGGCECLYNIIIMDETADIISCGGGGVTKIVSRTDGTVNRIFNVKEPKDYIERIDEMIERKNLIDKYIK